MIAREYKLGLRIFFHPLFIIICLLILGLPLVSDDYVNHILIMIFFYAFLGLSWDICGGYTGLFSIGHAGFFGIGAYTSSYLFINFGLTPWLGMIAGGIVAVVAAAFLGYLTCRYGLIGVYFALATIAFAECLRILVYNLNFVGGPQGMLLPFRGDSLFNLQFSSKVPYYYIMLVFLFVMMLINGIMRKSKLGYYLTAIREDEQAADSLGVNLMECKIKALIVSAFFTAVGGSFYAQYVMFIEASSVLTIPMSVEIIMRPIIGGMGTVLGPVIGSGVLGGIAEVLRVLLGRGGEVGVHLLIYGVIIILVVIYMPSGIMGFLERSLNRVFGRGRSPE